MKLPPRIVLGRDQVRFNGDVPVEIPDDRPRVEIELTEGSVAVLSPLTPEDRELLEEGLDHLSIMSRFTRFGRGVSHLSNAELDYLTEIDQRSHVAWGAIVGGEVAGVARYITIDAMGCSEVAVTVVDEFQRRGLGSALIAALVATARADAVAEFCFEVVPGNAAMEHIIEGIEVHLDDSGSLIEGRIRMSDLPRHIQEPEFVEVMEAVRNQSERPPSA